MTRSVALSSRSTKAQLLAHIAAQDAQLLSMGRELEAARLTRAVAKPAAVEYQAPVVTHRAYYDYVAQARADQRRSGAKVVSYLTFAQWSNGGVPATSFDDAMVGYRQGAQS